jgi:hypothetical protein
MMSVKRTVARTRSGSASHGCVSRVALQTRLGHADYKVTERYINAAGELFPGDVKRLEERLLGFGHKERHNGR